MTPRGLLIVLVGTSAACGAATHPTTTPPPRTAPPGAVAEPAPADATAAPTPPVATAREPALPPPVALMAGLMPLKSTGVDEFRIRHPTYDGRGVLIAILDTGIDPGVDGLITTSTGAPKVIELRDFSGEGRIALSPVTPGEDGTVSVGGQKLAGAGRIGRLTSAGTWYAGRLRELPLGKVPAADLNGDGNNTDAFPVIVVKATDGWAAFIDSNLNGSFEDEMPLHDYREGRETISLGTKPITLAANFTETGGVPTLDFFFDNGGHGTHVAGIAAGHSLFNVTGFDGVAPGAQLLGLKIANAARGGISVTGSMQRAMRYAARYAEQRNMPLVINLSFGVGNEHEGHAVIDSIVNAFLVAHPNVVFTISAGNDGPGLSTVGFPGSADLALSIGATYPGAFARPPQAGMPAEPDVMGWWSSRGGELIKPDLVTPGVAFSSVPRWDTANEVKGGTSMAAPHAAGLAACLLSAMQQSGRRVSAADVAQALRASAVPFAGETVIDDGAGLPRLEAAYRWLVAGHQGSSYVVRTLGGGSAAFRGSGFASPDDTLELFRVRHAGGLRAAQFLLRSSVPWLSAPASVQAGARETEIPVTYATAGGGLTAPGIYVGVVRGWNPSDTLAGPVFTLANTVVVPFDVGRKPLFDERRAIGRARVQRYPLRVSQPGTTLEASVTLPDSAQQGATARLYEPGGQPFRDAEEMTIGHAEPGTARFVVRAEDLTTGVYELDVFAPPLTAAVVTVRAAVASVALNESTGGGEAVETTNPGEESAVGRPQSSLLGAERSVMVAGRGTVPESLTVRVPEWAARAVVDVSMPSEQWDDFTDFGVTDFDSTGQQVGQGALNYATGRHTVTISPSLRGHPLTVELFPAFAREDGVHPWRGTIRVSFLLEQPRSLGDGPELTVVPGARATVPLVRRVDLSLPEGFAPLVELRIHSMSGSRPDAVRRLTLHP